MSFQNNNAADAYQDFMLPTALNSDFSSEDLADDMEGLQLTHAAGENPRRWKLAV